MTSSLIVYQQTTSCLLAVKTTSGIWEIPVLVVRVQKSTMTGQRLVMLLVSLTQVVPMLSSSGTSSSCSMTGKRLTLACMYCHIGKYQLNTLVSNTTSCGTFLLTAFLYSTTVTKFLIGWKLVLKTPNRHTTRLQIIIGHMYS